MRQSSAPVDGAVVAAIQPASGDAAIWRSALTRTPVAVDPARPVSSSRSPNSRRRSVRDDTTHHRVDAPVSSKIRFLGARTAGDMANLTLSRGELDACAAGREHFKKAAAFSESDAPPVGGNHADRIPITDDAELLRGRDVGQLRRFRHLARARPQNRRDRRGKYAGKQNESRHFLISGCTYPAGSTCSASTRNTR